MAEVTQGFSEVHVTPVKGVKADTWHSLKITPS